MRKFALVINNLSVLASAYILVGLNNGEKSERSYCCKEFWTNTKS